MPECRCDKVHPRECPKHKDTKTYEEFVRGK